MYNDEYWQRQIQEFQRGADKIAAREAYDRNMREAQLYAQQQAAKEAQDNSWGGTRGFISGNVGVFQGQAQFGNLMGVGDGATADYLGDIMQRNRRRKEYTIADMVPFASDYWTNGEGAAYDIGNMLGSSVALGAETAAIMATGGAALGALGVGGAGAAGAAARGAGLAGRALAGARAGASVSEGAVATLANKMSQAAYRAGYEKLGNALGGRMGQLYALNILKTPVEVSSEMGNAGAEALEDGASLDEARKQAMVVGALQMPLLAFSNTIESAGLGGLLTKKAGEKVAEQTGKQGLMSVLGSITREGLQNAWEEGMQQSTHDYAQGKQSLLGVVNPGQWNDEALQQAAVGAVGGLAIGGGNAAMRAGVNRLDAREEEAAVNNSNEQSAQRPKSAAVQAQEYLDALYDNENLTDDQRNEIGVAADSEDANTILQTATKYGWQNPTQQQQDSQNQPVINAQSTNEEQLTAANGAVNAAVSNVANGGAVVGNMNANGETPQADNGTATEQVIVTNSAEIQQQENEQLQQPQEQATNTEEQSTTPIDPLSVKSKIAELAARIQKKGTKKEKSFVTSGGSVDIAAMRKDTELRRVINNTPDIVVLAKEALNGNAKAAAELGKYRASQQLAAIDAAVNGTEAWLFSDAEKAELQARANKTLRNQATAVVNSLKKWQKTKPNGKAPTAAEAKEMSEAVDSGDIVRMVDVATKYGYKVPTALRNHYEDVKQRGATSILKQPIPEKTANQVEAQQEGNGTNNVNVADSNTNAEESINTNNNAAETAEEIPTIKLNGKEVKPQFIDGGKRISFKAPGFGKKASAAEKADYHKAGFKWDSKLQAHVADNTEEARAFLQKYNKENVDNTNTPSTSASTERQEDNSNDSDVDKIDKNGYFLQVGDFVTDESKKNTKNVHYYVLKNGAASNGVLGACVRREYQEENFADYVYSVVFYGEHKTEKKIRGLRGLGEVEKALKGYKKIKFGKANANTNANKNEESTPKYPLASKLGGWEIDTYASSSHTLIYHPTDADSKLSRVEVRVDEDGDGFSIQFRKKSGVLVDGEDYWYDTAEETEDFLKTFDERNLELEGTKNENESGTENEQNSVQDGQSETTTQGKTDDNQDKGDNSKTEEVTDKSKGDKAEETATVDNVAEKYPEAKDSRGVLKALKGIKAEDRPAAKEYNSKLMKNIIDDILQRYNDGKATVAEALGEIQKLISAYADSKPFAPLAADDNHSSSYGIKEYMREVKAKLKEAEKAEAADKEAKRTDAIAEAQKETQAIVDDFKTNTTKTLQDVQKEIEDVKLKLEAALKELGVKPLTATERKNVYDNKLKIANATQTSRDVAAETARQKEIREKAKAEEVEAAKAKKEKQKAEKADKQETPVEEDSPAKMKQEVKSAVNEAIALAEEAAYGNKETGEVDQKKKNEYDDKITKLTTSTHRHSKELANILGLLRKYVERIKDQLYYRYFRTASEDEKAAFALAPEGLSNDVLEPEDINLDALGLELDEQAKDDIAVNNVVEAVLEDEGINSEGGKVKGTAVQKMLEEAEGTEGFDVCKAVAERLGEILVKRRAIYQKYYDTIDTAKEKLRDAMVEADINPPKSLDLVPDFAQTETDSNARFSIRQTPMGKALYQAAWHGTPAIIEGNLSTKRIGDGEGAIIHGWGLYFAKSREVSQERYRERLSQSRGLKPTGKVSITDSETGKKYSWDIEDDDAGYDILAQEDLSTATDQAIRYFLEAHGNLKRAIRHAENAIASRRDSLMEWEYKTPSSDEDVRRYKEALKAEKKEKTSNLSSLDIDSLIEAIDRARRLEALEAFSAEDIAERVRNIKEALREDEAVFEALKSIDFSEVKEPGELLSVELPENDVLLDEQKRFKDQPFRVRKALERIFGETGLPVTILSDTQDGLALIEGFKANNSLVQPLVEELKKEFKKYNAGKHDDRAKKLFRMTVSKLVKQFVDESTSELTEKDLHDANFANRPFDEGFYEEWADVGLQEARAAYANEIEQGLISEGGYDQYGLKVASCFRDDGTVFEPWGTFKPESVSETLANYTGYDLYGTLARVLSGASSHSKVGWGAAKLASMKLLQHGIKGIHYTGGIDGECFVIWDDNAIEIKQHYDAAIRKHKQEFERSYGEIVSKVKQMFGSDAKIEQLQNNDLEVTTGNGKKFLVKVSDKVLVSDAELKRARSEHGFDDNGEVSIEGKFLPLEDSAYDAVIEVSKDSRANTEAHEITHAVVKFALNDKEAGILYKRAKQIAKEHGLTANSEEIAADAIRNFVSAREHGYVTDFTKSEIAELNKTTWGRMMLRANKLGRKAALFTKLNEKRLSKSAWGRLILAKAKLQRAVAKLFRKVYDGFKHWQALNKDIDSFHELGRRIELGEVWNEKKLDKTAADGGIIKKSDTENGGAADGNDGRGQEDLRGTAGRVQGRQESSQYNRGNSEGQRARNETAQRNVRGVLLTEKKSAAYENIDPTIHADEWQNMSDDLQGFSNALNEARAASKHGAFVNKKSPEELQEAKVAMTADGLAGCAVEPDGNITAVFKNPSKKTKGAINSIITMARAMGGTKMDCFGKPLLKMYEQLGYKVVARIPFTDRYIDKHDDGTAIKPEEQILLDERPDVYVLMTNGDDFATATEKIKNGEYKVSTQEELDKLPVFEQLSEDDDNYTRALNYRDDLLNKQQEGKAQYSVRQKSRAQDPGITGINNQYKEELEKAYAEGANNNKIAAIMNAHQQELSEYMQQAGEAKRERNKIRAAQLRQDRKDFKEGKIDSYTVGGVTIVRGKDGAEVVKEVTEKLPSRKYTNERHAGEKPANATQKLGSIIARPEEKSTVQKAKGWITELKDNFYKHWVDKYDALSIFDGAIADADGNPINPADTILGRTQMVTNAASGAARALIDGDEAMLRQMADKYKIKNMVSLQMLMEKIGAARDAGKFADYVKSSNTNGSTSLQSYIDAVENYLVARSALESAQNHRLDYDRAVAEWEEKGGRGKKPEFKEYKFPGGMTEAEVMSVIKSAPAEFKEYAKMFKGITDNMLDVLYNSGLITGERYLAIKDRYKAYCPLMRDFSDTAAVDSFIDQINGGKGIGNVSDPLKSRSSEGSERDIVPPLATIIKSINALTMKAERNRVGQYAVRQAKKHRLDNYIKEVEGSSGDSKNCIFTVVINGQKHSYQTIPELYPAITAAVEPLMKIEMALLTKPAQLLRTGSTMSPSFIIRNFLRDTLFAAVSTKNGFVPIYDSIRGAYALLHNKQLRGEFMSSGVVSSNFYGDGESIVRSLNDMAGGKKWEELSAWEIVKAVLGKPIQGLEWTSNLIEQSTRMGEFMRAREKGKNVEQAAYDAVEITLNFNRSGATGQQINRMVPFFNACIQGGDKLYRLFKADPKTTLLRIGVYMVLPSLVLWLMNHDEDWYKELDPNIKMQNWILPGGIRIPKPQEAGVLFGSGFEAALDTANGQDPKAMKTWSKAVLDNLTPGIFPTLILPLLEWQANYSFFRGKPVVSKSQERLPDELQYGPYTSEASKAIGSIAGLSPAKLDNLWRGYTGTMGMALWQAPDLLVAEKRNLPEKKLSEMAVVRDFVINDMNLNRTMNDFYALSQAATQWQAGYGKKGKPTVEVSGINTAARTIAKLQKEARDITSNPKYNSAQKRILVDKLQAKQRKIAELCIKKYGSKFNY